MRAADQSPRGGIGRPGGRHNALELMSARHS